MTAFNVPSAQALHVRTVTGLVRIGAFLSFVADVFGEAHVSMREANKKYPNAGI